MNFLNPFFLIGSVVLAVPVLIHLVRRERAEVVQFSSLMFLLKIPKRMVRQQMLKNLLLMLLRILLIALLVAVFLRPYMVQSATNDPAKAGSGKGYVMLLDNSYSMRYGMNFEKLKSEADKKIDALGGGDRMAIVAFNDAPTVLLNPTSDKGKLKAAVSALEPSSGGTRYFEAFSVADRLLGQFGSQERHLIMISDFQRIGWNRSSRENVIDHDVKADLVSVAVENSNNVGIDNVSVDATSFVRTYAGKIVARIHNYRRDKEVSVPVALLINDKEERRKTVTVPAAGTALADFSGFDLALGFAKGKIQIVSDDPLPQDNEFLFTIERREKLNVLILDEGKARQSFLLKTAFTAAPDLPFNVTVAQASKVSIEEVGKQDILIVNDVQRLSDAVRDRMVQARKTGQGQFVVMGASAELSWWGAMDGFPAKPLQKVDVFAKDRNKTSIYLTSYNKNHGIFKPFQTGTRLSLNTAQFTHYTELELKPGATAVAKFENGSPALVESAPENRGLLVFASTLGGDNWNDLPLKPSFVLLMHETAKYLTRYNAIKGWYTLGEGIPVIGTLDGGVARVVKPNGEQDSLGEIKSGEQRRYAPADPGFYQLRVGREERMLAVNSPSNEGNLETIRPDDLFASVQSTEAEARQAGSFTSDDKMEYARRQMGWWWLLLVALIAGVVEIYIANNRGQSVRRAG